MRGFRTKTAQFQGFFVFPVCVVGQSERGLDQPYHWVGRAEFGGKFKIGDRVFNAAGIEVCQALGIVGV